MSSRRSNVIAFSGGAQPRPLQRVVGRHPPLSSTRAGAQRVRYPWHMSDLPTIDGRALSSEADEIVSTLMEVLAVHVALIDVDEKRSHARMSSWWFSHEVTTDARVGLSGARAQNDREVCVRINRRWILRVARGGTPVADDGLTVTYGPPLPLSTEQVVLAERAAERLRRFLPATSTSSDVPGSGGSSGSGSSGAELGIPISWVRKVRN